MAKNSRTNESISLKYTSFGLKKSKEEDNYTEDDMMNAPLLSDNSGNEGTSVIDEASNDENLESIESIIVMRMPQDGGSVFSSFLNMANSIIGAGLPYSFLEAGIFTGMILLVVLTIAVDWTIRLLVLNAKLSGRSTYQDIMHFCFGRSAKSNSDYIILMISVNSRYPGMCAFCVIIGDTIPEVIKSIFPDISKLAKASGLALISMVIIVVCVTIEGPLVDSSRRGSEKGKWDFIHPEVFQPTMSRFAAVTHLSTFVSMVACMLMALTGYLVFTDKTQGNILNNFPGDDVIINVARFCFGFNIIPILM
ncbi:10170_t:CDS:2, partial [Racocetra persica]